MKILFATFECLPFVKVGGLADVSGTLPKFLKKNNQDIRIILPLHKKIDKKKFKIKQLKNKFSVLVAGKIHTAGLWTTKINKNIPVYFIENKEYFDKDEVYAVKGQDYPDNPYRFIFFSRACLEVCKSIDFKPDIIHSNDMQTALIPAYLKTLYKIDAFFSNTRTLYTIHNVAYQGHYPIEIYFQAGFTWDDFTSEKMEYYGHINFMKAGIVFADKINTVSPTYAKEIQSSNELGRGMEGILKARTKDFSGIINGLDSEEWSPETDKNIKSNFSSKNLELKNSCKKDLLEYCKIPVKNAPVIGIVSRLDPLKGFDIIIESMTELLKLPIQFIILGLGYEEYQNKLKNFEKTYPSKLSVNLDFDNVLAHKIFAGSDMFLMTSKTEPCGLGQMISMKYATVPIVHKTGGLIDTVKPNCGFLFEKLSPEELVQTIKLAIEEYKNTEEWKVRMLNCMKQNFSWNSPVKEYLKLYRL